MTQSVTAKLKYLRITPRKTRFLADVIRGLPINEAEARLLLSPQRSSKDLLKLLRSAVSNARHNNKIESANLFIKEIMVNQGPKYRRFMPRARGSASPVEKKTSHITIVLGVSDKLTKPKFTIQGKPKKEKATKKEKSKEEAPKIPDDKKRNAVELKPSSNKGFFQKMFRRKSI